MRNALVNTGPKMGARRPDIEVIGRVAPKKLSWLSTYATGKELLVLGPGGTGKSTFADYLRFGALGSEGKQEMTYAITKSPTFSVRMACDGALVLKVRRAVDTPGQVGPVQHANLVGRRRPHVVIIMLDSTKAVSATTRWLRHFCSRLDTVLRTKLSVEKRLDEILVVLNKHDKTNKTKSAKVKRSVAKVLSEYLSVALGIERVRSIPLLECISIRTKRGTVLIDNVISELAARLAGQNGRFQCIRTEYLPVGKARARKEASKQRQ